MPENNKASIRQGQSHTIANFLHIWDLTNLVGQLPKPIRLIPKQELRKILLIWWKKSW